MVWLGAITPEPMSTHNELGLLELELELELIYFT